ncbi:RNA polymerase subunit sigma-70 [Rhizobium leguminosarum]|nr:RNA polymerase subunit sigma-70 [Rhizobium leguminosarum]MBY5555234.1 RNA polymerase subunit sigma-70 [Rhizobium leguminosarum]MBY5636749.1 RNA polymerase subunit sigma-70 [Rhizobium leguminosarum]MBY5690979.1 RNA polymerase subunit sigma-70 [Rhizobium leguminosarum]MBY5725296.1 RNA polymerase subunit sigma-70 [Rhizobium leguminosarum]MBY5745574.1 RNA polymerase subunit sigma-70 [Rhizobium leguminosarum]
MENQKRAPGRPPHIPSPTDRRVVELLAAEGVPQLQLCRILGISQKTLRAHFRAELNRGASRLEAALVHRLYALAGGKGAIALRAIIFILKARFGWSPYLPPPR